MWRCTHPAVFLELPPSNAVTAAAFWRTVPVTDIVCTATGAQGVFKCVAKNQFSKCVLLRTQCLLWSVTCAQHTSCPASEGTRSAKGWAYETSITLKPVWSSAALYRVHAVVVLACQMRHLLCHKSAAVTCCPVQPWATRSLQDMQHISLGTQQQVASSAVDCCRH